MQAFERVEVTTIDRPDELQFVVVRQAGWFEMLVPPVAVAALALWLWFNGHQLFSLLVIGVGSISLIANWARGSVTKLRVTETELVASGNLNQVFSDETRVQASDVTFVGFGGVGEDGPMGLCVGTGWSYNCLLPGLNEGQATAIADAISKRFPEIPAEDRTPTSILFGEQSGITTLGLSSSEKDQAGK